MVQWQDEQTHSLALQNRNRELGRGSVCLITALASLTPKHCIRGRAAARLQQELKYPRKGRERSPGLFKGWRKFLRWRVSKSSVCLGNGRKLECLVKIFS